MEEGRDLPYGKVRDDMSKRVGAVSRTLAPVLPEELKVHRNSVARVEYIVV